MTSCFENVGLNTSTIIKAAQLEIFVSYFFLFFFIFVWGASQVLVIFMEEKQGICHHLKILIICDYMVSILEFRQVYN